MSGRRPSPARRILPWVFAGLVILLAGTLLLPLGGWLLAGAPAELEFWVVLAGVIVLGAATIVTLLGDIRTASTAVAAPRASPRAAPETAPAVSLPKASEAPAVAVSEVAEPPPPETHAPEPTPLSRPMTTSIPGAYLASLGTAPPPEMPPWDAPAAPIAASLPFAAIPRVAEDWRGPADGAGDSESALLEVELARLRARVRELESAPPPVPGVPTPSLASSRSGASRALPSLISAPEPPKPTLSVTGATRACVGCGTMVPPKGPDLRCGSCSRLLCTTCYWRYGSGAGLQRCPDCRRAFEESGRTAISGGRSGPAIISTSPASTARFH